MANTRARRGTKRVRTAAVVATDEPGAEAQPSFVAEHAATVVVLKRGKSKKKRRYSSGLEDVQRLERRVVRAADRVADAVAAGMDNFRRRSDRSALKKRDGALRDLVDNLSRSTAKTVRKASRAPRDLTRGFGLLRWSQVRGLVNLATAPLAGFLR